jgi:hypothetical protein
VLFEIDTEGRFNWALGDGDPSGEPGGQVELVIGRASLRDVDLAYRSRQGRVIGAALSTLEFTDDGTGMLDLGLAGSFEETPVEISGRLGTFIGFINAGRIEHDLEGRFDDADFALRGSIDDLSSQSGVEGEVSFAGPRFSGVMAAFGLEAVLDGPFSADVAVREATGGSGFNLHASLGEITAKAEGTVDSIGSPEAIDVSVDVSGPDVSAIGELAGVGDLPTKPFSISGRVQWAGFPLTCDDVEVRVGDNTLSAHGILGKPPLLEGTDFEFTGGGSDISAIAALAGLDVPRERFTIDGHLVRVEQGIDVQMVELSVGGISVEVDGMVGDPPGYEGTSLSFRGRGPNLARLDHLVGVTLPAEPFSVSGRLAQGQGAIELDGVRADVGDTFLQVSGQLTTVAGLTGTDVRVKAAGPDASQPALMAELDTVPDEPFSAEGRIRILADGYRVDNMVGSLGSLNLRADGFIELQPTLVGSDTEIHLDDSDLAHAASIVGVRDLPRDPISVDARVRIEEPGYRVTGLHAVAGEVDARVDGLVGRPPEFDGTDLEIDARGSRIASFEPYLKQPQLPNTPFSVSGGLRLEGGTIDLDRVLADLGGHRVTVHGTVVPERNLAGTDVDLGLSGPQLRELGRILDASSSSSQMRASPQRAG